MTSSFTCQSVSLGYNAIKMGPAVVHKQREKSEAVSQGQRERVSPMVRLEVEDTSQEGCIPACLPPSGFGQVISLPGSQLSYLQHGSWLRSFEQWQFGILSTGGEISMEIPTTAFLGVTWGATYPDCFSLSAVSNLCPAYLFSVQFYYFLSRFALLSLNLC